MATPEEQIAALTESNAALVESLKAAEAGKGGDKTLQERNDFLEEEMKKVVEARGKAKDDKRLADDALLLEQGEFKILSAKKQEEIDELVKKLAGQDETLGKFKERDEAKLKTLLEGVPENLRDTVANNSGTLAEKIDLAEKLATVKPAGPGARPGGDTHTQTDQEEYDQAVKDGDISKAMALKRALFKPKG